MQEQKDKIIQENITFAGVVVKKVYSSDDYNVMALKVYSICDINGKELISSYGKKNYTCVALFPCGEIEEGGKYTFCGNMVFSEKYGKKQFRAFYIKTEIPKTRKGIEDFLTKHINGVGPVAAKNIVDTFGLDTFDVIENNPTKLCEIKGISIAKSSKIYAEYITKIGCRDDIMWFNQHGINNFKIITTIKQKYKGIDYKTKLSANPYILINDIKGIGFTKADQIAMTFNIEKDSPLRIAAAIKFILENAQNFGHVYLTRKELLDNVGKTTCIFGQKLDDVLDRLLEKDVKKKAEDPVCFIDLINDEGAIYERSMYLEERKIAKYLVDMQNSTRLPHIGLKDDVFKKIDRIVKQTHSDPNFTLDISQKEAIFNSINSPISIITGGPGTGKTTTLNTILTYLNTYLKESEFVLLAPTGKAAKRMSEQTGRLANTIHKAVGFGTDKRKTIEADTIIVDEMSMTDMHIMSMLLKSIGKVNHLIFVGDIDQLPSVGCGNILKDLIESHVFPVSRLNVIHRQAEESGIIKYSHGVIEERMFPTPTNTEDFVFVECDNTGNCEEQVIDMYTNGLPKYLKEKGFNPESIQILTPFKQETKHLSSGSFNNLIQKKNADAFKHGVTFFKDTTYYEGDKVIHIKNDYDLPRQKPDGKIERGVMNGETGIIVEADSKAKTITVQYGDDFVAYTKDSIGELSLAYALTIHKSQGSEYSCVIIPIVSAGIPSLMNKNLLYTAITRAKNLVVLIGSKNVIARMVHTKYSEKRNTKLQQRLIDANGGTMLWA